MPEKFVDVLPRILGEIYSSNSSTNECLNKLDIKVDPDSTKTSLTP